MQEKIICVVGPTACGKTKLGVLLAKRYGGEVVSADSMQIYKGMTIGTAAPTAEEMEGVPHHMIAVADPAEQWSAARYAQAAIPIVEDILARGKRPILVGGTGLWLDAVVQGLDLCRRPRRRRRPKGAPGPAGPGGHRPASGGAAAGGPGGGGAAPPGGHQAHPPGAGGLPGDWEDHLRPQRGDSALPPRYDAVWIGLQFRDRADMKALIDRRVDKMVGAGLLDEVRSAAPKRPAPGRHGPPGHRIQGVPGGPGRHRLRGGGHRGGEAPLPAVRQAPADLAAAEPGHPLDLVGEGAGFCPGPPGFDGNPGRRWRILAVSGRETGTSSDSYRKRSGHICRQKRTYRTCFSSGPAGQAARHHVSDERLPDAGRHHGL